MLVPVHMLAFGQYGDVRQVEIPLNEEDLAAADASCEAGQRCQDWLLERVFHWGQNDHQEQDGKYSVSCGDVAEKWGRYWLCVSVGWRELSRDEWLNYLGMNHMERMAYYMDSEMKQAASMINEQMGNFLEEINKGAG